MKKCILVALFSLLATSAFALEGFGTSQSDLKVSMDSGSNVLVVFGASWCGPCQRMKRDVWSTQDFLDFSDSLGVDKFYFDTDQNGALARKWGVNSIPAWFLVKESDIKARKGPASKSSVKNTMNSVF
jgi:thiol-disulfide isomerase/thioredoxin